MIYTIGEKNLYDRKLASSEPGTILLKKGKCETHSGGAVFETFENAAAYIERYQLSGYGVYGIIAMWEDTGDSGVSSHRVLLEDAPIIDLKVGQP